MVSALDSGSIGLGSRAGLGHRVVFWEQHFTVTVSLSTQGPVVQRVDNAIHKINHYPTDSTVCFGNTYPLDSDLSVG